MQTFLPYKDFQLSAKTLDSKRLNKQILEGYQILKVLSSDDPKAAWRNHPAVKMWAGYEKALLNYVMDCVDEATERGIKTDKNLANIKTLFLEKADRWGDGLPYWFHDKEQSLRITATHKANLYIKDPVYYVDFASSVEDPYNKPCCEGCSYYWVTHKGR